MERVEPQSSADRLAFRTSAIVGKQAGRPLWIRLEFPLEVLFQEQAILGGTPLEGCRIGEIVAAQCIS